MPGRRAMRQAGAHHAYAVLQASSLPGQSHSIRGVALFPVHPKLPGYRGTTGPAWDRGQLRDHPLLDDQVWSADRQKPEEAATYALAALAATSAEGACTCGAPSMMRARFSTW